MNPFNIQEIEGVKPEESQLLTQYLYQGSPGQHHKLEKKNVFTKLCEKPLWELAFRPWFLLASLFSVLSLTAWLLFLNGLYPLLGQTNLSPLLFHIHEMIFGFAATVAVAFVLTAVQTWTGLRSLRGFWLLLLTGLWLWARGLLWFTQEQALLWFILVQGCWWLTCIGVLTYLVIKARSSRNYIFIPVLIALMTLHYIFLYQGVYGSKQIALHLGRTIILILGLLVSIIGGRIIPLFTQRGATKAVVKNTPVLDRCLPVVSVLGIIAFATSPFFPLSISPAVLMITAGILHLLRLFQWDSISTRTTPLLWSLHIAYGFLGVGLIVLGSSYFIAIIHFSDALHLITLGSIGGMILAMMARVSLGHTGRLLKTTTLINSTFLLIFAAALLRFWLTLLGSPLLAWTISGMLWILAFLFFLIRYTPILFSPKN